MLFDLEKDPQQHSPIKNEEIEKRLLQAMGKLMAENEAPDELYWRMGIKKSER